MSDVMLLGVLRMPVPASVDAMWLHQFFDRARQAADRIEADAAEIERLRDAVRSARADEANCWLRRVAALTEELREVDARYIALLKAVADGVAMQPRTGVLDLGPNVRGNLPAEAGLVSPVRDDSTGGADRAYKACRSGSG